MRTDKAEHVYRTSLLMMLFVIACATLDGHQYKIAGEILVLVILVVGQLGSAFLVKQD